MRCYPVGARVFQWVFDRHHGHNADYQVCPKLLCWLAWRLEWWMWHKTTPKSEHLIKWRRFAIRVSRWQGFWFETWRPAWFGGEIRYVTCGLGFVAFYAGDPDDWRERLAKRSNNG